MPSMGDFWLKPFVKLFLIIIIIFSVTGTAIFCQPVKIGLLVQDSSYTSTIRGAGMAVNIANEKGGLNGRPFRLVVRSMEGPWGTGSKQAVDLISMRRYGLCSDHTTEEMHTWWNRQQQNPLLCSFQPGRQIRHSLRHSCHGSLTVSRMIFSRQNYWQKILLQKKIPEEW